MYAFRRAFVGSALLVVGLFASHVAWSHDGGYEDFYNMKQGLRGDGVSSGDPKDLEKKLVRASRSQGMWTGLSQNEVKHLEPGFGKDVAEEFKNVPKNFSWSLPVRTEMNRLADALQDAM